jgi:hypothetical protein
MTTRTSWSKITLRVAALLSISAIFLLVGWQPRPKRLRRLGMVGSVTFAEGRAEVPSKRDSERSTEYGNLPLSFEQNEGQTDRHIQFLSHGNGYFLFLAGSEAVFALDTPTLPIERRTTINAATQYRSQRLRQTALVHMKLLGASTTSSGTSVDKLPGTLNYLIGNDPKKWRVGVPTYANVRYADIYPGIDLIYYGNQRQLEYDFVVKAGADPTRISLKFDGIRHISLDNSGDLTIEIGIGTITLRKPMLYQLESGQRKTIDGHFLLHGSNRVDLSVGAYDHEESLIIDPVLAFSTYLGGTNGIGVIDEIDGLAVDSQGNTYVSGYTHSIDFPTVGTPISGPPRAGGSVAFVSKLNADGTALAYSTYLGGSGGTGGFDIGYGLALDASDQAYVTGFTCSKDFPITSNNAYQTELLGTACNAFLSKLSTDGQSLLYSTYFGGGFDDEGVEVAVDRNENAYVVGLAGPAPPCFPFPVTPDAIQNIVKSPQGNAFLTRIDTTKSGSSSLIYSTLLGGSSTTGRDIAYAVAVDDNENAFVAGAACSSDFPITSSTAYGISVGPHCSGFLSQVDTTKSGSAGLVYSTFIGGMDPSNPVGWGDDVENVLLDSSHKVYVSGAAGSSDFPSTTGATYNSPGNVFVAKFDTSLSQSMSLLFSTLIPSNITCSCSGLAVDAIGNIYVAGEADAGFPTTPDAIQAALGIPGPVNPFFAVLSPNATQILYGTYFGGPGSGSEFVSGLVLDPSNNIYIAGDTGSTAFQTTPGAFQPSSGSYSSYVVKLTAQIPPLGSSSIVLGAPATMSGLVFKSAALQTAPVGGNSFSTGTRSETSDEGHKRARHHDLDDHRERKSDFRACREAGHEDHDVESKDDDSRHHRREANRD